MDAERARELLAGERRRVERELRSLAPASPDELSSADQHPGDEATELYQEETDQGRRERLRQELDALERAEKRLEAGTYGLSVESGEPIPDERLEAYPLAERTIEEQRRYERG
ncbi:MAG TPA: TraR/DksA C4-type zinc finger protein [Gaiellaceae bacterium]|nr:TraR/DksA C4-type zinc finger protein [Gaiellaceae bacterium]